MKRICRFSALFLLLSILFVSSALAVSSTNESSLSSAVSSIPGASRNAEDVEGESFSLQNRLTPAITGTAFSKGSVPSALNASSLKFGHLRSMKSADGKNTYAEWRFHQADATTINGREDAYISLGKRSYDITEFSYQVLEFDLTTMTTFPSNLWIFSEWRGSDSSGKERKQFGSYNDTDGLWHFGDKTYEIKQNEWVHITLVFAIRRSGTDAYNFSETVARIFINGELYNEIIPYPSANLASGIGMRQHYIGIGWPYGKAGIRTGMDDDCSVCIDNVALTTFDRSTYLGNLEAVFADDFTNLGAFTGDEIIYSPAYTFPSDAFAVATVTDKNGNITPYASLEAAVAYVENNALTDAKVTLLADQYNPIDIPVALTLDLNGYTLYGDATTSGNAILSSIDGNIWTFSAATVTYTHITIYQAPFSNRDTAVGDYLLVSGDSVSLPTPEVFVNASTGERQEPTGNWLAYDTQGNLVSNFPTTITASQLGKSYILCPEYLSSSVAFTLIKADGTVEQHETLDGLYAIPNGATVILRKDTPASKSFYGQNYYLDLNGYTVYTLDGAKEVIFRGKGTIYVYSSRSGARVFTGSYMKNGQTDANGNPIYTNQAAFIVSDEKAASGTRFMLGYRNADKATPYRIDMFCGSFSQLGAISNVSVYLNNLNIIAAAGDNKGIFTTRNSGYTNRYWQIDNCDILITNSKPLTSNVDVGNNTGTYVFNNTNIRGNGSLFGSEKAVTADCSVTFNNTNVYGTHSINAGAASYTDSAGVVYPYTRKLTITGKCCLPSFPSSGISLPEDHIFIPKVSSSSSGYFAYPAYAQYAKFETGEYSTIGSSYQTKGYVGHLNEYKDSLFQSVAIDTSVNVLLYLPKSISVEGVYLDDVNLLNPTAAKVINGDDYFVVRVAIPPKEAYQEHSVILRFKSSDLTITLDASLLHYATKLSSVEDTSKTGTYYKDSQALMKYVLYYIRTAATSIGTASASDLASLDALLGDFTLSASDKVLTESVYTTTSVTGKLTAATLNLDSKVGMVFQVAEGFIGTIRVDMPNVPSVVRTYTTEEPATSTSFIVLANIPAYALREDVTVTITPSSGSASVFTYNLATYVNGTKTDISYAVYAYAKAASNYRDAYPTASVLDD
ncbi:MAG: hypothetical protein IKC72_05825 [Clostridia bacterium]|nr:hypothetical protein [Clostridia bacterium]